MNHETKTLPIVYSCSGCSNVAQLANHVAVRLDRGGDAEMSCIAGVGGDVPSLLKIAHSGRPILAIDGCPLVCAKKSLERHGIAPDAHLQLGEHGVHLAVAADRERRRAVARDRDQPAALLLGARRQRRHGHPARVQAAEERFDEIGGGREDQQHRVCRAAVRDDLARDPERAAVNVAVAHHAVRHAAEAEVAVCEFVGRRLGAIAQHVGEIGRGRERRRRGERAAGGEGGLDG